MKFGLKLIYKNQTLRYYLFDKKKKKNDFNIRIFIEIII